MLLSFGYRHRSRLDVHERDWAITPFYAAAAGGYSSNSNPGNYFQNLANSTQAAAAYAFRDNGCAALGGTLTRVQSLNNTSTGATSTITAPINAANPETSTAATTCQFQFTNFNDLVNEENHYQLYGEVNYNLSDTMRFHGEVSWARDSVPNQRISPANGNTQFPTSRTANCLNAACSALSPGGGESGSLGRAGLNFQVPYNVPATNPGLQDMRAQCLAAPGGFGIITAAQCTQIVAATNAGGAGFDLAQNNFRFVANAGYPTHPDGADHQSIEINTFRVSGGLTGDFSPDLHWDTNVLWAEAEGRVRTGDLVVDRVQLALNGFGSRNDDANQCTAAETNNYTTGAGSAALGCFFFNPMSNAIARSATNGQANPFYRGTANPAVINDPKVVEWMYGYAVNVTTNQLFVADAVVSGDTPLHLPGGNLQFAVGTQYRWDRTFTQIGDFSNNQALPCVDSVVDSTPACAEPNGPWIFFGSTRNIDTNRNVMAAFGEMRAPVFSTFEATLAARYERYDNGIGDTFNPKLSIRWQALSWLAFRASAGTTFRAPSATVVNNDCATGVANLLGQYRSVRTCGNPNLQPETADAYNVGFILQRGGFNATLDYWLIDFQGELTTEGSSNLVAAMFPGGAGSNHACGSAAPELEARFLFPTGRCASLPVGTNVNASDLLRVDTFNVNGPDTRASGVDFRASYDWDGWFDGHFQVGAEATYLIEYSRGAFTLLGAPTVVFAAPFDRAGSYDFLSAFFSYPQTKANGWINFRRGGLNVRYQLQYTEGVSPAINTITTIVVPDASQPTGYSARLSGKTDDFWQHNLIVQYQFMDRYTLTLAVQNILDTDPPFATSNFNYDYTNGNPLGRTFQIGLRGRF